MRESKVYGPGETPGLVHVGEVCVAVRGSAYDVGLFLSRLEMLVANEVASIAELERRCGERGVDPGGLSAIRQGAESMCDELKNLYELVFKAGVR